MCLLRPGQPNSHCGHDDCKKFYKANHQACLYSSNGKVQNNILQAMTMTNPDLKKTISSNQSSTNQTIMSGNSLKRAQTPASEISTEGEGDPSACNKKVKTQGNNSYTETGVFAQANLNISNPNPGNLAGFFSQPTALANNQTLFPQARYGNLFTNPTMLTQMPQNGQTNQFQNLLTESLLQSFQLGMGNLPLQSHTQPEFTKAEAVANNQVNKKETKTSQQSLKDMLSEFETRTMEFFENQNKMLLGLGEKNELIQDTLDSLIGEVSSLKKIILNKKQEKPSPVSAQPVAVHQPIFGLGETINGEELISYLYDENSDFEYQFVLTEEFPSPLYRERNFGFTVQLVDRQGNLVENSNRFPLVISVYTCENPPKYIDCNTAGNKIIKGFAEKDLVRGSATFEKIQIKEVTSHFRNGWIFLMIHPKLNTNQSFNVFNEKGGVFIDNKKIKPLVIEKVIVKAKKTKERDLSD